MIYEVQDIMNKIRSAMKNYTDETIPYFLEELVDYIEEEKRLYQ